MDIDLHRTAFMNWGSCKRELEGSSRFKGGAGSFWVDIKQVYRVAITIGTIQLLL